MYWTSSTALTIRRLRSASTECSLLAVVSSSSLSCSFSSSPHCASLSLSLCACRRTCWACSTALSCSRRATEMSSSMRAVSSLRMCCSFSKAASTPLAQVGGCAQYVVCYACVYVRMCMCMCVCKCMCVKCVGPNVVSTCIAGCTCMCRCDKLCTSVHEQIVYVQNTCEQVKWKLQFNSQVIPFTMAVHPTCIEGSLSVPKFSLHPRHLLHQLIPLALQGMHPLLQKCQLLAQDHLLSLQSSQPLLQHSHTSTI